MFKECAQNFTLDFSNFTPYSKACERDAWDKLFPETKSALIKKGEDFLGFDFPYLKATDFMEFSKTGNRTNYEDKLFVKRKALNALVLAECCEYSGRFLDDIINGIFAICDESAWQLPAHNSYIRDSIQLALPDTTKPVIELFSCEAASVLSVTYYLLKDELDSISPVICTRIIDEIQRRVITPYITKHFWWMGKGKEEMCNWTIWCTQNILLTTFLLPFSNPIRKKVFFKACKSVDYFLKDYGDDGCCDEGAQYYRHAGLCLFQTLDILCQITDNFFEYLWNEKKIQNIASYILNVHVDDKYYINFADCSPIAGRAGVREYLFGKSCNLPQLVKFAAADYRKNPAKLQFDENNLYYRLQEIFTQKDILNENISDIINHPSIYYESVGLWIARNDKYTVGVKCGDNNDSHNHNDTGSITLYKNGLPLLIDIGVESYTKKTFSPQRYEIWTMQSDFHNLPTINGYMQLNGSEYKANLINHNFTDEGGDIFMDIADAYPKKSSIEKYLRRITLDYNGLSLNDEWSFKNKPVNPVILNFITYEKPFLKESELLIGELGKISWTYGNFEVAIETLPVTDSRLKLCWKHDLYRIRLTMKDNSVKLLIS